MAEQGSSRAPDKERERDKHGPVREDGVRAGEDALLPPGNANPSPDHDPEKPARTSAA